MPPSKSATRFWIDPSTMSDQEIFDFIMSIKLSAKMETSDVALPEKEDVDVEVDQ